MARVSKTSAGRFIAQSGPNNAGQEQRQAAQTQTETRSNNGRQEQRQDPEPEHAERQEEEKKRKGKHPIMKEAAKRGRGEPMKGAVTGIPKIPSVRATAPKRGRGRGFGRKPTFAYSSALYYVDAFKPKQEVATNSDPEGEGKEEMQETDEVEEDEACNRFTNGRKMDDDSDEDDDVMPGYMEIKV